MTIPGFTADAASLLGTIVLCQLWEGGAFEQSWLRR